MNHAASSQQERNIDWKELYVAALFEQDKDRLPEKIALAQLAIATKKQELSSGSIDERRVLENAAFSLQALAQCFAIGNQKYTLVVTRATMRQAEPDPEPSHSDRSGS